MGPAATLTTAGARENAACALATLRAALARIGWEPRPGTDPWTQHVDFDRLDMAVRGATVAILPETERFVFLLHFRERAAPSRRRAVAEFVTRVNSGLVVGNFELGYDDGSLRFKSAVDFTQVVLGDRLIRNAIVSAMDAVEHYAPYLTDVLAGARSASEAVELADVELTREPVA